MAWHRRGDRKRAGRAAAARISLASSKQASLAHHRNVGNVDGGRRRFRSFSSSAGGLLTRQPAAGACGANGAPAIIKPHARNIYHRPALGNACLAASRAWRRRGKLGGRAHWRRKSMSASKYQLGRLSSKTAGFPAP